MHRLIRRTLIFLAVIIVAVLVFTTVPSPSSAKTIIVDSNGNGDNSTISEAIDASEDGGTILVYNGTYVENVVIDKAVTIIGNGSGATIIDAEGKESPVTISSENVTITGFTIRNGYDTGENAGIKGTASNVTIADCSVKENGMYGILFSNVKNINISDCGILDNGKFGIYFNNVDDSTVERCELTSNSENGFWLTGHGNTISRTSFTKTIGGPGMKIVTGNHNIITHSTFSQNDLIGLDHSIGSNNTILHSTFAYNAFFGFQSFGIGENNLLMNCTFVANSMGIRLWYTPFDIMNCTILDNFDVGIRQDVTNGGSVTSSLIQNNRNYGIQLGNCTNTSIFGNEILDNGDNAQDDGNNFWDAGLPIGGNHWSDFDEADEFAYDNDTDGIIDSPYPIPGGDNVDRYPLGGEVLVPNEAPIADAGPDQMGFEGGTIFFDGSGSTDDDEVVNWTWTFFLTEKQMMYGPNPVFTFMTAGNNTINVTVLDKEGLMDTDKMWVNISVREPGEDTVNPVVIFSIPDRAFVGDIIILDGTQSYDNVGIKEWTWTIYLGNGSTMRLDGPLHNHTFDLPGISIMFTLQVWDEAGNTRGLSDHTDVIYRPGSLSGKIIDSDTQPIVGVNITLDLIFTVRETQSDDRGNFSFENVSFITSPSQYAIIIVSHSQYESSQINMVIYPNMDNKIVISMEKKHSKKGPGFTGGIMIISIFASVVLFEKRRKRE